MLLRGSPAEGKPARTVPSSRLQTAAMRLRVAAAVLLSAAAYYVYLPLPSGVSEPWKLMLLDALFRSCMQTVRAEPSRGPGQVDDRGRVRVQDKVSCEGRRTEMINLICYSSYYNQYFVILHTYSILHSILQHSEVYLTSSHCTTP